MLKIIYSLFLGVLLAIFVGVGISTFYQGPNAPQPPIYYERTPSGDPNEEAQRQEADFAKSQSEYENKLKPYNRNVSIVAFIGAILLLGKGLILSKKMGVISDGLLLGSVFTMIYSLIRGLAAQDNIYSFVVVSLGLFLAIVLGYIKFLRPSKKLPAKKPSRTK